MRLKSEMWVMAYLRRCATEGCPGVVVRRGDVDAGTIYIKVARLDRTADLYGPVPAGFSGSDGERRWVQIAGPAAAEQDVDLAIEREMRMDSDVWILEIEDRQGRSHLEDWLTDE